MNGICPLVTSSPWPTIARDLGAHLLEGDAERLEHARGKTFLFAQQAEQEMLGADVVVLERPGLILGQNHDLASSLGEPLEHRSRLTPDDQAEVVPLG